MADASTRPEPCSPGTVSHTIDKAEQSRMTPDAALARLQDGNARFVSGQSLRENYPAQIKATATGQYPFAVVLSCIDSRSTPEIVFDQGIGNLFVARVAGNYAPTPVIGSIEFATKVSGAKLVVVMGHTECVPSRAPATTSYSATLPPSSKFRPAVEDVKRRASSHLQEQKIRSASHRSQHPPHRRHPPQPKPHPPLGRTIRPNQDHRRRTDIATGKATFYDWSDQPEPAASASLLH